LKREFEEREYFNRIERTPKTSFKSIDWSEPIDLTEELILRFMKKFVKILRFIEG
jgi:hypothetical protein